MNKKQILSFSLLFYILVPAALFVGLYFQPHPAIGLAIGFALAAVWITFDKYYK